MSKLLFPSHFNVLNRQTHAILLSSKSQSFFPFHFKTPSSFSLFRSFSNPNRPSYFSTAAKDEEDSNKVDVQSSPPLEPPSPFLEDKSRSKDGDYPSGELEFEEFSGWRSFIVKLRMLFAFPWERVPKGSVLSMKLRGQIVDQLRSRFSMGLSLPQICENFIKAAYDPRISDIYLQIEPLNCGWAKVEEIRRHILNFKKSGSSECSMHAFHSNLPTPFHLDL